MLKLDEFIPGYSDLHLFVGREVMRSGLSLKLDWAMRFQSEHAKAQARANLKRLAARVDALISSLVDMPDSALPRHVRSVRLDSQRGSL
ncbi:hypothetical protein HY229_00865 [Candidatus Acetothermia bacterium]|nr:hypothetical protein [Candidatus Acetothermia bacterium]